MRGFVYAFRGILRCIREERNFRFHIVAAVYVSLFSPAFLQKVSEIRSDEYYVNMMIAWYFATALAKQYESAVVYLEEKRLDTWTHNKTIQKATESYRIPKETKEYLKTLKIK